MKPAAEALTRVSSLSDDAIQGVVEQILAHEKPLRIILFGSRAEGTARPDSDIDLLVIMPDGTPRREAMVRIGSRISRPGVGIDLLVATPSTLSEQADNPGLIYRQILHTGRELYVAPTSDSSEQDGR